MANSISGECRGSVLLVTGTLSLPDHSLNAAEFTAARPFAASKRGHNRRDFAFRGEYGVDDAAYRAAFFNCLGTTGKINSIRGGVTAVLPTGTGSSTFDVYKNGTTILYTPLVLTVANILQTEVEALLVDDELAIGDLLEVVHTVAAGTGAVAKGAYLQFDIDEDYV